MPQEKIKTGPRDVFFHLLAIITLYGSAINFGILLFKFVNLLFPDVLQEGVYGLSDLSPIRWAVATLLVVFPVYLWLNFFLERELDREPFKRQLRTRKWLIYFTLFAAALVIIGDLVALIYNFLQGEFTVRFILKVLTILLIAVAVFGYYRGILRRDRGSASQKDEIRLKILGFVMIGAVAVSVILGFFVAGSPKTERMRRFDGQRVSDLQGIQGQVVYSWQQKNHLPQSLKDLQDSISGYVAPSDPETGSPYEYKILGNLKFELCATFETQSISQNVPYAPRAAPPGVPYLGADAFNSWVHGTGLTCFIRTIDPELYKIQKSAP